MNTQVNEFFDQAVEKLNVANEELLRPEEDIVTYVVCKNSQMAIENYLKGFLLQNGIDATNYTTVVALYNQCLKVNNKFENINLADFKCGSHKIGSTFCNEITQVSDCFEMANTLNTFLRQEKII